MMSHVPPLERILGLDPTSCGFAYAVLEGPDSLIDWGVKHATCANRNAASLRILAILLDQVHPSVVVIEHPDSPRRCRRVRDFLAKVIPLAASRKTRVCVFWRRQIVAAVSPDAAITKYELASRIAAHFPELAPRLPRKRKPWMSEDERMNVFDAVALALAYYGCRRRNRARRAESPAGDPG